MNIQENQPHETVICTDVPNLKIFPCVKPTDEEKIVYTPLLTVGNGFYEHPLRDMKN